MGHPSLVLALQRGLLVMMAQSELSGPPAAESSIAVEDANRSRGRG